MTPPPRSVRIFDLLQIRNPSSNFSKIGCFGEIENPPVLAKLSEPRKTVAFFKKVKISANSCDEQKLTIPENEKLSFVKHSFTTELSRPDTTFSTKIVTVPDLWALTFHFFEILIFKTFSSNLRLQEILRKRSFWLHLPSFWLDLVTEIHWYLARSEKCFLKIMFSRLESVCVTQLHWLK